MKKSFKESPRYKDFKSVDEKLFQVEDGKGKLVFISHFKKHFMVAIGITSLAQTKKIFSEIQKNIINKFKGGFE